MRICFPVQLNEGIESKVFNHFGSAPLFLLVDVESRKVEEVINRDAVHEHGQCNPVGALGGRQVDAVVVGGIGPGALNGLARAGVRVLRAEAATVAENLNLLLGDGLPELGANHTCGGHGHGGGCSHSH